MQLAKLSITTIIITWYSINLSNSQLTYFPILLKKIL